MTVALYIYLYIYVARDAYGSRGSRAPACRASRSRYALGPYNTVPGIHKRGGLDSS